MTCTYLQMAKKEARRFTQIYFKTAAKMVALAHRVQGQLGSNENRRGADQESISTSTSMSKDQQAHLEAFTTDSESGITISSENTLTEQRANEGKGK